MDRLCSQTVSLLRINLKYGNRSKLSAKIIKFYPPLQLGWEINRDTGASGWLVLTWSLQAGLWRYTATGSGFPEASRGFCAVPAALRSGHQFRDSGSSGGTRAAPAAAAQSLRAATLATQGPVRGPGPHIKQHSAPWALLVVQKGQQSWLSASCISEINNILKYASQNPHGIRALAMYL